MDDDYGYFGKGITGYVHYNEATKRGSGGGRGSGSGCLTLILTVLGIAALIVCIAGRIS